MFVDDDPGRADIVVPRAIVAGRILIWLCAALLLGNVVTAVIEGATGLPLVIAIAVTVVMIVSAIKVGTHRAWGRTGGWLSLGLAVLVLAAMQTVRATVHYESRSTVTAAMILIAAIYAVIGMVSLSLLSRPASRAYYDAIA